jgi:vacuolar-type H+-ATPase subunit I/STV1
MTITTLLSASTPFIILLLGWWYNAQQKKKAKQEKDQQEAAALKKQVDRDEIESLRKQIEGAVSKLNDATNELSKTQAANGELLRTVQSLSNMNRLNGQYTHELAQLVMVLAEGLRDQHLDGNITKAVAKYRKFEEDALGAMVTGDYDASK